MKLSHWMIVFGLMVLIVNIGQLARIIEIDRSLQERMNGVQAKLASLDQSVHLCSLETSGSLGR